MSPQPPNVSARLARVILAAVLAAASCVAAVGVALTAAVVTASPAAAATTHDNTVFAFGSASFHGSTESIALPHPLSAMAATANGAGYWMVTRDGAVFSFNAPYHGGLTGFPLAYPVVGITATPTGGGYWLVTSDGSVFPFGDAHWYGAMTHKHLNAPIKALIPGPGGKGYWLYAGDGGVFGFGGVKFYGSTGNIRLNRPIVSMASSPSGHGYWLVAADGGIFGYGDAHYYGSTASIRLAAPIVGMARTGSGHGYWLAGSDGGVFGYGDAHFYGSTGSLRLAAPVVGMARDGTGHGYWLAGADGGVFSFGDAHFRGSAAGFVPWGSHIAQLVGMPDGNGYRMLAIRNVADVALVGPGASGAAVLYIQRRLASMGYWLNGINGVFDADMQQAVWAFQKVNNIPRTGAVDAATQVAFRTAFRPRPRSTTGTLFEINKTKQVLMYVINGTVVYVWNTSTGNEHPFVTQGNHEIAHTPEGVFHVLSQINALDIAPLGTLWRPKFFTNTGVAVHGDPPSNVPPYPASHGCARISNAAINFIWAAGIMPLGTTVWVYV